MKTFTCHKSLEEIKTQCEVQGLVLDTELHDGGADHVAITSTGPKGERAKVLFNTFNGRFFGTTPDGIEFTSDDKRDGTPWFDALLEFFYTEKT